jgi:outer membrane protein OmpA-like peptidoglycan-associated protein
MLKTIGYAVVAATLAMGTVGCQNKVVKERDDLYVQNRELQAKNDAMQAALDSQRSAPPAPVVTPPPAAAPTNPAPAPAAAVTPAPSTPAAPPPTIEGAETTADPVQGTVTVNIQGDVLFDAGKADLRASSKKTLDQVAAALTGQYKGKPVRVEGHTDSDPIRVSKWKSNQELSEARAKAVRDYLASKGVSASRLTTTGFGAEKPKGQVKSKNRRVEIVVVTR